MTENSAFNGRAFTDEIKIVVDTIGEPRDVKQNKGWVCHGLHTTLYTFSHFNSYGDAIDYAVNLGGDTDTNACIAGYLNGVYYSYDAMAQDGRTRDNIVALFKCATNQSSVARPKEYHIANYITEKNIDDLVDIVW